MENLSMAGETELMDYDEMRIELECQEELDREIQDIINKDLSESKKS